MILTHNARDYPFNIVINREFVIDFFLAAFPEDVSTERRCNVDFTYFGFNQAFE
jgi:hypothetical protein